MESWLDPITIAAVYCPPKHSISKGDFDTFFVNLGNTFIVGGNFNAKINHWGSRITNPRGRIIPAKYSVSRT